MHMGPRHERATMPAARTAGCDVEFDQIDYAFKQLISPRITAAQGRPGQGKKAVRTASPRSR